jgi:hypothetical protein
MVAFASMFWYWVFGLLLLFLPMELWAAIKTPTKSDTFSEFVWWTFGIKPRRDGRVVKWARARRFILTGMCVSLTAHFVGGVTFIPVAVFGAGCAVVMGYAVAKER